MKILTFNWHTSYLYLLSNTQHEFHVVYGWNEAHRPLPDNMNLVSKKKAKRLIFRKEYDVVLGHQPVKDLLIFGLYSVARGIPYIQLFHVNRQLGISSNYLKAKAKKLYSWLILNSINKLKKTKFIFVSEMVKESWKFEGKVINLSAPLSEMKNWKGQSEVLLIVGNSLHREHFDHESLDKLRHNLPIKIIGENPSIEESYSAEDWNELRNMYRDCRAYVNLTQKPEDGYNTATLEAMASGMPVLTLEHPTSPVEGGYNGLVVQNSDELIKKGELLLNNRSLANKLGNKARETIREKFSMEEFIEKWEEVFKECKKL